MFFFIGASFLSTKIMNIARFTFNYDFISPLFIQIFKICSGMPKVEVTCTSYMDLDAMTPVLVSL